MTTTNESAWGARWGPRLFDPDAGIPPRPSLPTLPEFYEGYLLPEVLSQRSPRRSPRTIELDRLALKFWEEIVGHLPLDQIAAETWRAFRLGLAERLYRGRRLSSQTIKTRCTHIAFILRFAGPPDREGGPEADLIRLPYTPIPPAEIQEPKPPFSLEEIGRLFAAAEADPPACSHIEGIEPRIYWPALLAFSYNSVLRIDCLMRAEHECLGKNGEHWLFAPARTVKRGRKNLDFYLNPAARAALDRLGRREGRLFPWRGWPEGSGPGSRPWFFEQIRRIEKAAGLPRERWFGTYGLRRAALTWIAGPEGNVLVARIVAGHTAGDVLLAHYTWRFANVPPVLDRLPQPISG